MDHDTYEIEEWNYNYKNKYNYIITTDKKKIDVDRLHDYLANESYWCVGISKDRVLTFIKHSVCYSVIQIHDDNTTSFVGFARFVTDFSTFSYLADVYVDKNHRERGLAKRLTQILSESRWCNDMRKSFLITFSAQSLYEKFGWKTVDGKLYMDFHKKNPKPNHGHFDKSKIGYPKSKL
eukprot:TRINITY_DN1040_c1_g1_i1.p1 TRINITY_DN1040_c1_g1~~TRINITY_DN1040_c1_g1_i1.p1  ORF type:complete len:179 (+),score=31.15 TRINITY_DN1040_c1_g1_i1:34-570(+)